jgi:CopG family nickel-responsive transcriptional regulator
VNSIDRSKAIQTALHSFIDQNNWEKEAEDKKDIGAGAIIMSYNNHIFNQDTKSVQIQHKYNDKCYYALHLDGDNCLENIMVKGKIKIIKNLVKDLLQNRGIKNLKVCFVSFV